jgi:hypothetical protein
MQEVRGSNPVSSTPGQRPSPPSTARQSRPSRSRYAATACARPMRSSRDGGDAGDHCGSRLSVDPAHGTAAGGVVGAAAGVAHQLVDHPGGDGGVLQPGREGMPQVRVAQSRPGRPPLRPCRPAAGCWWTVALERRAGCRCYHRAQGGSGPRGGPRWQQVQREIQRSPHATASTATNSTTVRFADTNILLYAISRDPKSRTRPPAPTTSSLPGTSPSRSRSCRTSTFRQPAQAARPAQP